MCLHFSLNLTMHADVPITSVNLPSKKLQFQYTGIISGPDTKFQLVYFLHICHITTSQLPCDIITSHSFDITDPKTQKVACEWTMDLWCWSYDVVTCDTDHVTGDVCAVHPI